MKRIFIAIELADDSLFDPSSEADQDDLMDDLFHVASGVKEVAVYTSAVDLAADYS